MRLNVKAFALTIGILWAVAILITGIANLIWPGYGVKFLEALRPRVPSVMSLLEPCMPLWMGALAA
jgi:hypothetical protein